MNNNLRPDSNFTAFLIYDVRLMIYDYMEDPLSFLNYKAYMGYALSCRSAYEEIREVALKSRARFVRKIKTEFLDKTGFTIEIPPVLRTPIATWPQTMSLEIEVPFTLVYAISAEECLNSVFTNLFLMFYPLFKQPFNSVTVVFKDTTNSRSFRRDIGMTLAPAVYGPREWWADFNGSYGRYALWQLSRHITHAVYGGSAHPKYCPLERQYHLRHSVRPVHGWLSLVFWPPWCLPSQQIPAPWPPGWRWAHFHSLERADVVRAKRIAIGYEYRESDHRGDFTVTNTGVHLSKSETLVKIPSGTSPEGATGITGYSMRSMDGRKGEVGLISNNGWALSEPDELEDAIDARMYWVHR